MAVYVTLIISTELGFEVRVLTPKRKEPPIPFEKVVGNVSNRLSVLEHALGDNDLRVAFTINNFDALDWKLKLVREAEHAVLFADVMGGQVFIKALEAIEVKLKSIKHFQAVILRYAREDVWMTGDSPPLLQYLCKSYPKQFHYFYIPLQSRWDSFKVHIKSVIADYGRYFTVGSSVFVDLLPYHDLDSEFIFEDCGGIVGPKLWDGIVEASAAFVHAVQDAYKKANVDTDHLVGIVDVISPKLCAQAGLTACGFPHWCNDRFRNLSIPIPKPEISFSGPGQHQNGKFVDAMVDAISKARSRITIAHKYFLPPDRLKGVLVNATRRGLRITIISQGNTLGDTVLQNLAMRGVGAANDAEAAEFLSQGRNVKAYAFLAGEMALVKSYHKKVVIVDDMVFGGSANMGPKSMTDFIDVEVSFQIASKALADEYDSVILMDASNHGAGVYGVSLWSRAQAHVWHFVRCFLSFANY